MNLKELIRKLPKEIVYKIRFLTYKIQDRMLLRDIKLYYTSNMFLRNLYYMRIIVRENMPEPEDKNWLINDIYAFLNNGQALMHGYIDDFYKVMMRRKRLKTKKQVIRFIEKLDNKPVSNQINFFLSIMNNYERIQLINYCLYLENS